MDSALERVGEAWLAVPEGADPAVPAPLLVMLHGAGAAAGRWSS